jgi:peptidoglycan/xylan/chitin deacetylase (PgdA/CDA1 family)
MIGRLDRLLTVYALRPFCPTNVNSHGVPILMYHSISEEDTHRRPYYRTSTPQNIFAAHLDFLRRSGYESVRLSGLSRSLKERRPDRKIVVITFDDGYRDFLTDAFPVLSEYGYSATMFLPTAYIGDQRKSFGDRECLTWSEVRNLDNAGIEFGSHTVTHPRLTTLSVAAVRAELEFSKKTIEDYLGKEVNTFAYPFAFPQTQTTFVQTLRDLLQGAGYREGVCTSIGLASLTSNPLFLERLPANGSDDPRFFAAKLSGAYNWMGSAQRIVKRVSSVRARSFLSSSQSQLRNGITDRHE